ncbi:MAG: phenylacetate-CoA oxygenase subunit PaaJ [Chitinophagaceae bacterium]|jgi:ring-1,2-phenylacetyl-CoA epoxidase subunit PaaD|nr:phenylacetate-CoA oxygenase subunit PaaJ [Chitinophagaceae bacterium]
MVNTVPYSKEDILFILAGIVDPEIPVVTIQEMGMLRDVILTEDLCEVIITPTYTGCPAMGIIEHDIVDLLIQNGIPNVKVTTSYSPAWTTDWMSEGTKEKLKNFGIAAPIHSSCSNWLNPKSVVVSCPRCDSKHTTMISQFGSTACKALYKCEDCKEPFDYFKCH